MCYFVTLCLLCFLCLCFLCLLCLLCLFEKGYKNTISSLKSLFLSRVVGKMHGLCKIGSGRDAIVYQSEDSSVAFKKGDKFAVNLREFTFGVLANLLLPKNTPKVLELFCHEDGDNVISMEKIEGISGSDVHHDVASVTGVLAIYYSLMKKNVYQNDLKGANSIWNDRGIFLFDFGIASTLCTDSDCSHLVSMASLFIQSILFPADNSPTWFSRQTSVLLRTRYITWIIGGTTRWLRHLFDDNSLQLHVNLRNVCINVPRIMASLRLYNTGTVASAVPPPLVRNNSSRGCGLKLKERHSRLSRRVCFD